MTLRILALAAALALPATAFAQPLTQQEGAQIDKAVIETLTRTGVPSVEIAVVRDGRIVLDRAWGTAAPDLPVARADMPYQIASNSKQFLAALLLMLQRDGKLSLDDHVSKWLPQVTGADTITLRELLSHTSGLQDFWPQDYMFGAMTKPVQPMEIVSRWAQKPLDYAPGTRWQYSNTGYVVAGIIAEKAGGAPLWEQMTQRIFAPLGLHPIPIDDSNAPGFPTGYHRAALGPIRPATPPAPGWLFAAGEISMTAADLARWDIARIERKLLTPAEWDEMETPVKLADGTTNGYGLGVRKTFEGGRWNISHGGESVGFLSQNTVWPDAKAAVVVLTNADFSGAADSLTDDIAKIVLPHGPDADAAEAPRMTDAKATLAALAAGRYDPAAFTDDAQFYFTDQTRADIRTTLSALGPLGEVTPLGKPRLRGGFVNRNFMASYGETKLVLVTYAEPGEHGRWEQFIVMPQ